MLKLSVIVYQSLVDINKIIQIRKPINHEVDMKLGKIVVQHILQRYQTNCWTH